MTPNRIEQIQKEANKKLIDIDNLDAFDIKEKNLLLICIANKIAQSDEQEQKRILDSFHELTEGIFEQLCNAETISEKQLVARKIKNWLPVFYLLLTNISLPSFQEIAKSFTILHHQYMKGFIKEINNYTKDRHIFNDLIPKITEQLAYASSQMVIYSDNLHTAMAFLIETEEEIEESKLNMDTSVMLKAMMHLNIAKQCIKYEDLNQAHFHLYKSYCCIRPKEGMQTILTRLYIINLKQYIDLVLEKNPISNEQILKAIELLPNKKDNQQTYFDIYSQIIKKIAERKQYALLIQLAAKLTKCNIPNYKKYGEQMLAFAHKKNFKVLTSWCKGNCNISNQYKLSTNEKNQSIEIILSTPLANPNEVELQEVTYDNKKRCLTISSAASIETIQHLLTYLGKSESYISETKSYPIIVKEKVNEGKLEYSIDSKEKSFEIPQKKTKKKTRKVSLGHDSNVTDKKNDDDKKEKSMNIETELVDAEKIGFSHEFKTRMIYRLFSPVLPPNTLFGYYTRENASKKVAEETHNVCERTLRTGKIGHKSPCIKYVKNKPGTYKIAPKNDYRVTSRIAEKIKRPDETEIILLEFGSEAPYTHSSQRKKLYRG